MRRPLAAGGAVLVLALGLNASVRIRNPIPDYARIVVFPETKVWIPDSDRHFGRLLSGVSTAEQADYLSQVTRVTARDLKEGPYRGFRLPAHWAPSGDDCLQERDRGILEQLIFRDPPRWNADGSWNY